MPFALARPSRTDLVAMAGLAVPVVVVQVGLMLMGVVDTIVVGHLSAEALAAVALGNLYVITSVVFGLGVLVGLDPLVAQAVGADDQPAVRLAVQRGLLLAVVLSIPSAALLLLAEPVLRTLGQPPAIVPVAAGYALRALPAVLPFYVFVVLRQTLQAHERMRPIVVTIVVANLANLLLDIGLVFGVGPLPALGALGSAWATTACRWLLALGLLVVARRDLDPLVARLEPAVLRWRPLLRTIRVGAPVGGQLQLELTAFAVVALLMGALGPVEVAAHQVALNLASLTFMVPLGLSSAAAVRVGHAVGRVDGEGARRAATASLACGAGFMAGCGGLFLAAPDLLAGLYTSVAEVRAVAAALIPIAGFFQVFDGLQVVSAGVLRGLGDTRTPLVANLTGFWLVGIPVSALLAFRAGLGPEGAWWGLVAGLGAVAAFLVTRTVLRLGRPVTRLLVE